MTTREELRAQATDLLNRLRSSGVPHEIFELLDNFDRRLTRIELGHFDSEEEKPTSPDRRASSGSMSAVIGEIFDKAKKT